MGKPALLKPLEWAALEVVARKCKDHAADRPQGSAMGVDVTVRIHGAIDQAGPSSSNVKRKATAPQLLAAALFAMPAGKFDHKADDEVDRLVEEIVAATTRDDVQAKKGNLTGALAIEVLGRGGAIAGRLAG